MPNLKRKNLKITLGVAAIVLAIAYLILSSFTSATAAYYMKVGEALTAQIEPGKYYRIEGKIDLVNVSYDTNKTPIELKFQIYDDDYPKKKLTVIYNDIKPDNFQEATSAVVQGKFNPDGTFLADTLNLKCPSKYEQDESKQEEEGFISKLLRSLGLKA